MPFEPNYRVNLYRQLDHEERIVTVNLHRQSYRARATVPTLMDRLDWVPLNLSRRKSFGEKFFLVC